MQSDEDACRGDDKMGGAGLKMIRAPTVEKRRARATAYNIGYKEKGQGWGSKGKGGDGTEK